MLTSLPRQEERRKYVKKSFKTIPDFMINTRAYKKYMHLIHFYGFMHPEYTNVNQHNSLCARMYTYMYNDLIL